MMPLLRAPLEPPPAAWDWTLPRLHPRRWRWAWRRFRRRTTLKAGNLIVALGVWIMERTR
jgi:hypothetical protein